jgi:LysR family glycine cleavage system transcriptional activator
MQFSRRSLPSLNALRAFEVSGRHLNFRAASEELGVTQGAVAQQVRLLEDHLGISLFDRLPRGLALTDQGRGYLADLSRAFDLLSTATDRLQNRAGVVTISVTPTFATKMLIPQLSAMQTALPSVELRTVATTAVSDFDRDRVDLAVRETRPPFPPALEARFLFPQKLVLVSSPHLVAMAAGELHPTRLSRLPLLHDAYDYWSRFFATKEKLPGATFNQTSLALDAALAGQGIAIACQAFVEADLEAGRLINLGSAGFDADTGFYLLRKRSPHPGGAVDAIWSWCIDKYAAP